MLTVLEQPGCHRLPLLGLDGQGLRGTSGILSVYQSYPGHKLQVEYTS